MNRHKSKGRINVEINDKEVARFLARRVPKLTNQEMNKSYRSAITEFAKGFDKAKLGKGGVFHVKRKRKFGRTPRGQPFIPARMRNAGFVAKLKGAQDLDKKTATLYTGNPLLTIRETGGTIRPKRGKHLFIKGQFETRGRGSARRNFLTEVRLRSSTFGIGSRRNYQFNQGILRPIIAKVEKVEQAPVLGFGDAWRAFQPRAQLIVRQGLAEVQRRFALEGAKKFAPRGGAASA